MGNKTFNTVLTLTRQGWGTYYNSSGYLVTAGAYEPRLDYNPNTLQPRGYLIESTKSNLLLHSEQMSHTTTWGNYGPVSVSPNAAVAPNGYQLADKLIEGNAIPPGSPYFMITQSVSSGLSSNNFIFSVYLKAAERYQSAIRIDDGAGANTATATINLLTGESGVLNYGTTLNPTLKVEPINNGWFRCSLGLQFTPTTLTSVRIMIRIRDNDGNYSYQGDGISGIYAWGAQLEAGKYPTSYIPTSNSSVSRLGDQTEVNLTNTWMNKSEGTFIIDAQRYAPGTSLYNIQDGLLLGISDNTVDAPTNFSNSMYVYNQTAGSNQIAVVMMTNNVGQLSSSLLPTANSVTSPFKFGYAYKTNDTVISTPVNMYRYPNTFENSEWTKSNVSISVVTSATTAPDGTYNARKVVETGSNFHVLNQTLTVYQGYTTTMAFYLKAAERSEVIFGFDPTVAGAYHYGRFNLATGVATTFLGTPTLSMTSAGNGWYLCQVTRVLTAGVFNNLNVGSLQLLNASGLQSYVGDGISGVYIWGAKLSFTAPDGSVTIQDNTVIIPPSANLNTVRIGCAPWTPAQNFWDGWIRSVKYYPTRLSNTVITTLSS